MRAFRRGYWWKFILVFFTGVVTTVVAQVAGIVVAFTQIDMEQIETWTGQEGKLFTEEYRELSTFEVLMKFINGDAKIDSLQGISEITPLVDDTLVGYLEQIGLTREDYEKLAEFGFSEYGSEEFISTLAGGVKLSTIFTPERLGNQGLSDAFSKYPSTSVDAVDGMGDFTLQNILNNELFQTDIEFDTGKNKDSYNGQYIKYVIDNITIDSIMTINDGDMLAFLRGAKIADIETTFRDAEFCAIVGEDKCTGVLSAFLGTKLGDLIENPSEILNNIELRDAFSLDGMSPSTTALLETLFYQPNTDPRVPATIGWLQGTTGDVNNMQLVVDSIKLQDVLSLDNMSGTARNLLETLFYQPNTDPRVPATLGWLQGQTGDVSNMQLIMDAVKLQDVIDTSNMDSNTRGIIETLFVHPETSAPITLGWLGGKTGDVANAKTVLDNIKLVDAFGIDRAKIEEQIYNANNDLPDPGYDYTSIQIILCYESYTIEDPETAADPELIGKANPNNPRSISGLQGDKLDSTIKDIKVGDVITIDEENPLLAAIKDTTIGDLSDKINTLTITDVVPAKYLDPLDPDYNKVLFALSQKTDDEGHPYTFTELSEAVNKLTISDYLEADSSSHPIISWLVNDKGDTNLSDIGTIIDQVPLNKIVDEKVINKWRSITEPYTYLNDPTCPPGYIDNPDYNKTLAGILTKKDGEGEYYTLNNISACIDSLKINEIIDTAGNTILETIGNLNVTASQSEFTAAIDGIRIGDVIDTSGSKVLEAIENITIGANSSEFTDAINNLAFGDIVDTTGSGILTHLSNVRVGATSTEYIDAIKTLGLAEFLQDTAEESAYNKWRTTTMPYEYSNATERPVGYEDNPECSYVLSAIYAKGGTVAQLSTTLDTLTLGEVIKDANDESSMLYPLRNDPLNTLDGATMSSKIKIDTVFADDIYGVGNPHTTDNITGIWKYLLREAGEPEFTGAPYAYNYLNYTLSDMQTMMDNFKTNMQTAKLRDLVADEIIAMNQPGDLEKSFAFNPTKKLGDYTLTELMDAISLFLT